MPITEYHSFNNVICIDLKANKVMKSGILNLKFTHYSIAESNQLTPDYKSLTIDNTLCEFEYIFNLPIHVQNQQLHAGNEYIFKIFENCQVSKTEIKGIVLKLERTQKLFSSEQKYFYTGVKSEVIADDLGIFGGFTPKTYVVANKNMNKLTVVKVKTTQEEQTMILNQQYQGCEFYHLENYLNSVDSKPVDMSPVNITHLI